MQLLNVITMKRFVLLILILFRTTSWSQNDSIVSSYDSYFDDVEAYLETTSVRIGLGAFIPFKTTTQYFKISPLIEINWNFPVGTDESIELATQFVVPQQDNAFLYRKGLDTLNGKATLMFNTLMKFKKDIRKTHNSIMDVGIGVGVSAIVTTVEKPLIDIKEDRSEYESLVSLLLSPELEYLYDINPKAQISLSFSVQYSPYKLKAAIDNDIGKWYCIPKMTYRF